jgi:hypothetical protein
MGAIGSGGSKRRRWSGRGGWTFASRIDRTSWETR